MPLNVLELRTSGEADHANHTDGARVPGRSGASRHHRENCRTKVLPSLPYAKYLDILNVPNNGMAPLGRVRWIGRDRHFPNTAARESLTFLRRGLAVPGLLTSIGKHPIKPTAELKVLISIIACIFSHDL